ncbi:hypothetical protein CHS0354_036456 [Potamilus streckersoni]|uniref:Rad21/Rec8-like protein N-terminal domain-containing protein n=1 Tax=Potamilus streckersoni TaxID=2493646 RepID=A0AAE0SXG0_9BIVA|nr:hypothetical protein CHS0354_036456 [Potamilus streckersoni]
MFYSQDILSKRGGKFGIIWLAATRMHQLTRRDIFSVTVSKACNDIIDYILLRAQPLRPGGPRPRLSLYLSSQLMFGVVQVYHRQQEYLLVDLSACLIKAQKVALTLQEAQAITLQEKDLREEAVTYPDNTEAAFSPNLELYDPLFGHPTQHLDDIYLRLLEDKGAEVLLERSPLLLRSPQMSPLMHVEALMTRHDMEERQPEVVPEDFHTVSSAEITMKEIEDWIPDVMVADEQELPMWDGQPIELITPSKEPDVHISVQDLMPSRSEEPKRTDLVLPQPLFEATPIGKIVKDLSKVPEGRAVPLSPGITPAPAIISQPTRRIRSSRTLILTPMTPSPVKRQRKVRFFADKKTSISRAQMRKNIENTSDIIVREVLPYHKLSDFKTLMSQPGLKVPSNKRLLSLWKRNAVSTGPLAPLEMSPEYIIPWQEHPKQPHEQLEIPEGQPTKRRRRSLMAEEEAALDQQAERSRLDQTDMLPPIEEVREGSTSGLERSRAAEDMSISIERVPSDIDLSRGSSLDDSKRKRPKRTRSQEGAPSEVELELEPSSDMSSSRLGTELEPQTRKLWALEEEEGEITKIEDIQLREIEVPQLDTEVLPRVKEINLQNVKTEFMGKVHLALTETEWTTFRNLCPPEENTRSRAVSYFTACLDLCTSQHVYVRQDPGDFGEIYICMGDEMDF